MFKEEALMWQQCTANSGEVGTFLTKQGNKDAISPVFKDTADFFMWCNENGWYRLKGTEAQWRYVRDTKGRVN